MDLGVGLVIAEQDHAVCQIADVDGGRHPRPDEAVLGHHQDRGDPALAEETEQLVQVEGEEPLLGHGVEVAVEAVNHDHLDVVLLDRAAHLAAELARRELGRIDLLDEDQTVVDGLGERHRQGLCAREERPQALVEDEHRRPLAPGRRRHHVLNRQRGLTRPGRAMIKVLLPRPSPPPVSSSIPLIPLEIWPLVASLRWEVNRGRGKTTIPP